MVSQSVMRVQRALRDLGFNPGEVDGVWGRVTIGALKRFQQKMGLEVDGVVGPMTRRALFGEQGMAGQAEDTAGGLLPWFQEALNLVGTAEVPGSGDNPAIINWARNLDIDYSGDDVPWCGLFTAHCIGATLPDEPLPAGPLGAQNWKRFGERCDPMLGAVLVFWRVSRESGLGHVGFYRAEDEQAYHVLGGNQSDSVNTARLPKSRFLDARWPATARTLTGRTVQGPSAEPLSAREQ